MGLRFDRHCHAPSPHQDPSGAFERCRIDHITLLLRFVFSVIFDMAISYSYDSMDPNSSGDRMEVEKPGA